MANNNGNQLIIPGKNDIQDPAVKRAIEVIQRWGNTQVVNLIANPASSVPILGKKGTGVVTTGGGITRITSSTLTITNPTGPTVDIETSGGGGPPPIAYTATLQLTPDAVSTDPCNAFMDVPMIELAGTGDPHGYGAQAAAIPHMWWVNSFAPNFQLFINEDISTPTGPANNPLVTLIVRFSTLANHDYMTIEGQTTLAGSGPTTPSWFAAPRDSSGTTFTYAASGGGAFHQPVTAASGAYYAIQWTMEASYHL